MNEGELGKIYADGDIIFREGDTGDGMYVIQSGMVRIVRNTGSGEVTIAILQKGELFGEMALFDRQPRSATAVASGNARVLSVDKSKLFTTINRDPTLVFKMLESMSQRIRKLDGELTRLKKENADLLHIYVDPDEMCGLILEEAKGMIRSDNGSLMLLNESTGTLTIKAAFGVEAQPRVTLAKGEGIAGDVLRTGREELVNDVTTDARFIAGGAEISSLLCVPLRFKDSNFGVINMSNSSGKPFSLDDLKLLHSLAVSASMAIQNAKVLSQLRDATDEVLRHATMLHM